MATSDTNVLRGGKKGKPREGSISIILGILGFVAFIIGFGFAVDRLSGLILVFSSILVVSFGIAAIVFGIIGIKKKNEYTMGKAVAIVMAVAGILVGIIVSLIGGILGMGGILELKGYEILNTITF